MTDVLEELSEDSILLSPEHVLKRVVDWKARIANLCEQLRAWLPAGVSSHMRDKVLMREKLMKQYRISAATLPVLTIIENDHAIATLVPRGLWIIGTNGRLDLFSKRGQAIIVDKSKNFEPPNWRMSSADKRRELVKLDADNWRKALGV